jgi:ketosteroid isomerase-like protein
MTANRRASLSLALLAILATAATSPAVAQGVESPRVPLRTAIQELNTLRAEYADLYNKKDAATITAMYLPDAVLVREDGMLLGQAAIGAAMTAEAPTWGKMTLASDTMRVFGNTAWDVGVLRGEGPDGEATGSRYLAVLRRGTQSWKISSLAVVPGTRTTARAGE